MANASIYHLSSDKIDRTKWDRCIEQSPNGLVYGYSWYLDIMADRWDGLVLNDYEAVMPLPWRKKYGIAYIYQPFLTAQLGLFAKYVDDQMLLNFLDAIPPNFKLWEFSLNHTNLIQLSKYELFVRSNYVLPLQHDYAFLYGQYRDNTKRNIRKAVQIGCAIQRGIPIEPILSLHQEFSPDPTIKDGDLERFRKLYDLLNRNAGAETYGVYLNEQLVSSCCFMFSHERAYYILVGNHPNGKTIGASHLLIDAFIKDHAGKNLLLDFEGSDIRNLAFFYSGFGAIDEPYAAIRHNNLPWYIRLLKREK